MHFERIYTLVFSFIIYLAAFQPGFAQTGSSAGPTVPEVAAQVQSASRLAQQARSNSESNIWSPVQRPDRCESVNAELLTIDISRSMLNGGLFAKAVNQIARHVEESPPCTYVIIARFGSTADVVRDAYITDDQSRQQLKDALGSLKATHSTTNFDECAKLIELVKYKLAEANPNNRITLSVRVLTDEISDPDNDKAQFSLREYFRKHLAGSEIKVVQLSINSSVAEASTVSERDGFIVITAPVSALDQVLKQSSSPQSQTPNSKTQPPVASLGDAEQAAPTDSDRFSRKQLLLFAVLGLAVIALLIILRLRHKASELALPEDSTPLPELEDPIALIVTESELDATGSESRVLRKAKRVPILPNVPVSFGTDAIRNTVVTVPIEKVSEDQFFSVTSTPGGILHLKCVTDALCDKRPVNEQGLQISSNRPFEIRIANRLWSITPTVESASDTATTDLFTRIRANQIGTRQA